MDAHSLSVLLSPHVFKEKLDNRGLRGLQLLIQSMDQWIVMDIEGTLLTKKVEASYIYKQNDGEEGGDAI